MKRAVFKIFLIASILPIILPSFAQSSNPTTPTAVSMAFDTWIDGAKLLEDVDILEHAYKSLHPGLYRYNTPAEVDLGFDNLREKLSRGATLADTYLDFAGFASRIRCGHTYPNFYNQPKAVVEALFKGTNRLPFEFIWLGGRMIITKNLVSTNPLIVGSEIISINGVSSEKILDRLMPLARADGSNDAKRRASLQLQGTDRYETFDIYYALCYPLKQARYDVSLRLPGLKQVQTMSVSPIGFEDRIAPLKARLEALNGGDGAVWTLSFLDPQTALLRMSSWALYNSKWDWKKFLEQCFTKLAALPHCALIIDLRDNEGGLSEPGDIVIRHLISRDLPVHSLQRFTRYRKVPQALLAYLETWDGSFKDWGTNAISPAYNSNGNAVFYRMTKFDDNSEGDLLHPLGPRFHGKVVVLMNSENSSATFQFEQMMQENKLGRLIGEPSGGNRRGINGGAFLFLRLPNTQIEMDVPLIATLPAVPQPDQGLIPDISVGITIPGVASGRDEILNAALKYLGRKIPSSANAH